ncbi:MAG TPA: class I lanthipeptide [Thermoanaerobaculia bacterium]|nr:class I lanthipeptide [Thermoanaerobaculia bacterium]
MKKKTFDKSLNLHRETLLALEDSTLRKALGASPVTSACKSGWTCCNSTCF